MSSQTKPVILSRFQAEPLLKAKLADQHRAQISLDLNLHESSVKLTDEGVELARDLLVTWKDLKEIAQQERACFEVRPEGLWKIQIYSEEFARFYSLAATERAPTMLVSGFPMHRIKDIDPYEDTLRKIRTVAPVYGRVLDTTMGLGYTAGEAAKTAKEVVTVELDPTVVEICRHNPWSQALFTARNIKRMVGDSFDIVQTLESRSFSCIFHDPPTFKLAGHLYSAEFYLELLRVLKPGGRLFHYVGDLKSAQGSKVAAGVARRLREVGFKKVTMRPEAFGLTTSA